MYGYFKLCSVFFLCRIWAIVSLVLYVFSDQVCCILTGNAEMDFYKFLLL